MTWHWNLRLGLPVPGLMLIALAASCGGTAAPAPLADDVSAVSSATGQHDAVAARRALDTLEADVARLRSSGALSAAKATTILTAARAVAADLPASQAPSAAPVLTSPTPAALATPSALSPTVGTEPAPGTAAPGTAVGPPAPAGPGPHKGKPPKNGKVHGPVGRDEPGGDG